MEHRFVSFPLHNFPVDGVDVIQPLNDEDLHYDGAVYDDDPKGVRPNVI